MDRLIDPEQLRGWIPIRLYRSDGETLIDWCYLGRERFTDPFFSQTIDRCFRRPFNLAFRYQTPAAMLLTLSEFHAGVSPAGFIFHVSRCGSTLVAQMLASVAENIVISEAGLINSAITPRPGTNPQETEWQRIQWLRGIVSALGQARAGNEKRLFIKFDAWHILDLSLIRRAFPQVPWIFLYRDPIEVLVSQLDQRGGHSIPGVLNPQLFGLNLDEALALSPEEYCAVVLGKLCEAGLEQHQDGGRLINYSELPEAVFALSDFFLDPFEEVDIAALGEVGRLDAKNPSQAYEDDTTRKRQKASEALLAAANRWVYPVYARLEEARQRQCL